MFAPKLITRILPGLALASLALTACGDHIDPVAPTPHVDPAPEVSNPCSIAQTLSVPQTVNRTLTTSACRLRDGSYADLYRVTVSARTTLQIDMTSTALDAYLLLQSASTGALVAEDDDSGGGRNARLIVTVDPATYIIYANSYGPNETGAYQLSVRSIEATTPVSIAVTPATASLTVGQSVQLTATVSGSTNTGVTWQSSAPGIVTVTATGLVNAVAAGTATITATSAADPTRTARSTITVTAPVENPPPPPPPPSTPPPPPPGG